MLSTDRNWQNWGAKDPYYSVVSHTEFGADSIGENHARFFDSGERFVADVLSQAARRFGGLKTSGSALDFGCGVARLAIPLARRFARVDGLDVSPHMLKIAQDNCKAFGIDNAQFHQTDGTFDAEQWPRRYAYVNSYIVLQHIPVRRGYAIIDKLLALLEDDGVTMLHVSLRRQLSPARAMVYRTRHGIPFASHMLNLLQGKPLFTPQMQMNEYDLARIIAIFMRHDIQNILVTSEIHRGVETARLMGRKGQ
jgi:SAM-dependent methyltransferase